MAKSPMTKLDSSRTVRYRNFRGRLEIWGAFSADGRWSYGREEMPGTPWLVRNEETGEDHTYPFSTLSWARRWTHEQDNSTTQA